MSTNSEQNIKILIDQLGVVAKLFSNPKEGYYISQFQFG